MSFQLAAISDLKSLFSDLGGTGGDAELDNCLYAATAQIQGITGRRFEYASITETLSGRNVRGRNRDVLPLSLSLAPIDKAVPVTVTENGVALTTSFSYSLSAGVIVEPGPDVLPPWQPMLRRQGCVSWADGNSNIVATWSGGFKANGVPVPADLIKLCCWFAWDIFESPTRSQKTSRSSGGSSASYEDKRPLWVVDILEAWTPK